MIQIYKGTRVDADAQFAHAMNFVNKEEAVIFHAHPSTESCSEKWSAGASTHECWTSDSIKEDN